MQHKEATMHPSLQDYIWYGQAFRSITGPLWAVNHRRLPLTKNQLGRLWYWHEDISMKKLLGQQSNLDEFRRR